MRRPGSGTSQHSGTPRGSWDGSTHGRAAPCPGTEGRAGPCPARRAVLLHLLHLHTLEFSFTPVIKTNRLNTAAGTRLRRRMQAAAGRGGGMGSGTPRRSMPSSRAGDGGSAGNPGPAPPSSGAEPSHTHQPHVLSVPRPAPSPAPAPVRPGTLAVPSAPLAIRLGSAERLERLSELCPWQMILWQ